VSGWPRRRTATRGRAARLSETRALSARRCAAPPVRRLRPSRSRRHTPLCGGGGRVEGGDANDSDHDGGARVGAGGVGGARPYQPHPTRTTPRAAAHATRPSYPVAHVDSDGWSRRTAPGRESVEVTAWLCSHGVAAPPTTARASVGGTGTPPAGRADARGSAPCTAPGARAAGTRPRRTCSALSEGSGAKASAMRDHERRRIPVRGARCSALSESRRRAAVADAAPAGGRGTARPPLRPPALRRGGRGTLLAPSRAEESAAVPVSEREASAPPPVTADGGQGGWVHGGRIAVRPLQQR
jgi:hypothetical protein